MEVVVPLAVDNFCPFYLHSQKSVKDRAIMRKVIGWIADKKLKEVAKNEKDVCFSFQSGEKSEHNPIILIFGLAEVGIC